MSLDLRGLKLAAVCRCVKELAKVQAQQQQQRVGDAAVYERVLFEHERHPS